ncbi:hypothetical protein B0A48_03535 [Cryoendolithus antarcticus]|uniref:Uncharacterized protein n=1 Tax=Cryoendolithus antarcticus TaxID=1507870 RepID=A0A1V8TKP3_9PEZI|nr:hypothetical protein B0A48_03535 [Cryoendolithus antarcticus]
MGSAASLVCKPGLQNNCFRLCDLIPELRDHVYDFYLACDAEGSMIDLRELKHKQPSLNLALSCRQIFKEVLPRWRAANESFWRMHEFFVHSSMTPKAALLGYRTGPIQKTMMGNFQPGLDQFGNLTPLGYLINSLQRVYIEKSPQDYQAAILVYEAIDRRETRDTEEWMPDPEYDFVHVLNHANRRWARRPQTIAVFSNKTMLRGLTEYLLYEGLEQYRTCFASSSRYRTEEIDHSEQGDITLLKGSRG